MSNTQKWWANDRSGFSEQLKVCLGYALECMLVWLCIPVCVRVWVCACMCACVCAHICLCIWVYVCMHMNVYLHVCVHMGVCVCYCCITMGEPVIHNFPSFIFRTGGGKGHRVLNLSWAKHYIFGDKPWSLYVLETIIVESITTCLRMWRLESSCSYCQLSTQTLIPSSFIQKYLCLPLESCKYAHLEN